MFVYKLAGRWKAAGIGRKDQEGRKYHNKRTLKGSLEQPVFALVIMGMVNAVFFSKLWCCLPDLHFLMFSVIMWKKSKLSNTFYHKIKKAHVISSLKENLVALCEVKSRIKFQNFQFNYTGGSFFSPVRRIVTSLEALMCIFCLTWNDFHFFCAAYYNYSCSEFPTVWLFPSPWQLQPRKHKLHQISQTRIRQTHERIISATLHVRFEVKLQK